MLAPHAREVHAILATASLGEAAQALFEHGVGALVVVDDAGQPGGIVTDRDLLTRAIARSDVARADVARELCVADVMSAPLITARTSDSLDQILDLLARHGIRRVPLEDDHGRITGILSFDDLIETLSNISDDLADGLRRQIRGSRYRGQLGHVRDEVDHGLHDLYERLQLMNWSARELFLQELDRFRVRAREILGSQDGGNHDDRGTP